MSTFIKIVLAVLILIFGGFAYYFEYQKERKNSAIFLLICIIFILILIFNIWDIFRTQKETKADKKEITDTIILTSKKGIEHTDTSFSEIKTKIDLSTHDVKEETKISSQKIIDRLQKSEGSPLLDVSVFSDEFNPVIKTTSDQEVVIFKIAFFNIGNSEAYRLEEKSLIIYEEDGIFKYPPHIDKGGSNESVILKAGLDRVYEVGIYLGNMSPNPKKYMCFFISYKDKNNKIRYLHKIYHIFNYNPNQRILDVNSSLYNSIKQFLESKGEWIF